MDVPIVPGKDQQILDYVSENYSCKICNNILIQCITLSCGHHYCSYCLDLLGGLSRRCPQCSMSIKHVQPNNSIDQEIDELINACSEPIQRAFATALDIRFQKTLQRNKTRKEAICKGQSKKGYYDCTTNPTPLEEIFNTIRTSKKDLNPEQAVSRALKSARKSQNPYRSARYASASLQTPTHREGCKEGSSLCKSARDAPAQSTSIDVNKVNLLFGIYDHVLSLPNEPNQEMAGGDYIPEQLIPTNAEIDNGRGIKKFVKRNETELENLIKETEDIVQLDSYIKSWTNKMADTLTGTEIVGISEESSDAHLHKVDDELFKASTELLQRLRGMQQHRQITTSSSLASLSSCVIPPPPKPRSEHLDINEISDDSDVEEYKSSFESLQKSLDPPQIQDNVQSTARQNYVKTPRDCGKGRSSRQSRGNNGGANSETPARKTSILDSLEESGNAYVKENIDFITQMRKFKDALLKIQNHEVETVEEIKELLPTRSFPQGGGDTRYPGSGQDYLMKCGGASPTPRRLSQFTQSKIERPGPRNSNLLTPKLPSVNMPPRPMTAAPYDAPASQPQQLISKQLAPSAPQKQHHLKRARANNPLYTAR